MSKYNANADFEDAENSIFVTQPRLPPLDDFLPYLEKIWASKHVTNNGPFHQQFETALCEYLEVPFISLFTNATIALITALKALNLSGEVITTPYSFVATAHAISWNGLTPVFVDIDPITLNIDPDLIEGAITPETTAILPVHVYGNPCDVDTIEEIAKRHNLKVIYDAAHAFGVECHCGSVLNHGDLSVLSFHATKVFNTFEGGAIVSHSREMKEHIDRLKNFGFVSETEIVQIGINGKMHEFSAALGLLQLTKASEAIEKRRAIDALYRENLSKLREINCLEIKCEASNYSYFPIFISNTSRCSRDHLYESLKHAKVHCRRYFYPAITALPQYSHMGNKLPVNAIDAASRVLCLPIYPDLSADDCIRICQLVTDIVTAPKSRAS